MKRAARYSILLGAALLLLAVGALAQRGGGRFLQQPSSVDIPVRDAEFHFIRLQFADASGYGRFGYSSRRGQGSGWWLMDWPDADNHFTAGIQRLTRIDTGDPRNVKVTDDNLYNYPWIYATNVYSWTFTDQEILRLREYLLRGGYLVTDDTWGEEDWNAVRTVMNRILPGRDISDIAESDGVMHAMYDIQDSDRTFIPGSRHLRVSGGSTQVIQPAGTTPAWRAMYDERGHMVFAANHNTDVGDAWEFADVPYYPEKMTALAYRYGINYIVYAMTH
jgi:Domain of unknown function (DUF4159)